MAEEALLGWISALHDSSAPPTLLSTTPLPPVACVDAPPQDLVEANQSSSPTIDVAFDADGRNPSPSPRQRSRAPSRNTESPSHVPPAHRWQTDIPTPPPLQEYNHSPSPEPIANLSAIVRVDSSDRSASARRPDMCTPPPSATTLLSSGSNSRIHDLMPCLDLILRGHMGPIAIDVLLQDEVSLLAHPEQFAAIIDAHQSETTAALTSLLHGLQMYVIVRGSSFYTLDRSLYPVLVVLVALLREPKLRKVVLHLDVLLRLLFLFVGTERVEVANVVDVDVGTVVMRGGYRRGGAERAPLARQLAEVREALPVELRAIYGEDARRAAQAGERLVQSVATLHTKTPSCSSERAEEDEEEEIEETDVHAAVVQAATSSMEASAMEDAEEELTAVDYLRGMEPITRTSSSVVVPPRRRRRCRVPSVPPEPSRLSSVLEGLLSIYAFYERFIKDMDTESSGAATSSSALLQRSQLCALRVSTLFSCELMRYHGIFVDRARFDAMMEDVDGQLRQLAQRGKRALEVLEARLATPGVMGVQRLETIKPIDLAHHLRRCGALGVGVVPTLEAQLRDAAVRPAATADCIRCILGATGGDAVVGAPPHLPLHDACRVLLLSLAIHERQSFKTSLAQRFAVGTHLRVRFLAPGVDLRPSTENMAARAAFSIHPSWSMHASSTGRLFSSMPNLQVIPKASPSAGVHLHALMRITADPDDANEEQQLELTDALNLVVGGGPMLMEHASWTLRHLYIAPAGCCLVSLDFNQIELRVLAHMANDEHLIQQLTAGTDVLAEITKSVLRLARVEDVQPHQRQAMKVVVYGLMYAMGPSRMDERIAAFIDEAKPQRIGADAACEDEEAEPRMPARELIAMFERTYPAVKGYLQRTRLQALHDQQVATLSGWKDLSDQRDPNRRKQSSIACAIQGGAADILQSAMRSVQHHRREWISYLPTSSVALCLALHDELIYAVSASTVELVIPHLRHAMERQSADLALRVPLTVSVKVGPSFGELQPWSG